MLELTENRNSYAMRSIQRSFNITVKEMKKINTEVEGSL